MHVVVLRHQRRPDVRCRIGACLVLAVLAASCSTRPGVVGSGSLPPPDGTQDAQSFVNGISTARRATKLPALVRDPALDELARKGLQVILDGVPDDRTSFDHLNATAPLAAGLEYGVGFEELTPGLDDRTRQLAQRSRGAPYSESLLGADPALDGLGWAAGGPWSVVVLRARRLVPADAPALQAAVADGVRLGRRSLRTDPALAAMAAEAVADGTLGPDDQARFGRVGGVPVQVSLLQSDISLPTVPLGTTLATEGPGTLRDPWLDRVGVAATVTDSGTVLFLVLATGDTDRAALAAQIAAAEPKATDLVNGARQEAGLPPVRFDPSLAASARLLAEESARRGCAVAMADPVCPGAGPPGADQWYNRQYTWVSGEGAFSWDLSPAQPGDERFTHFGAAALLAPDGTVWSTVLFSS